MGPPAINNTKNNFSQVYPELSLEPREGFESWDNTKRELFSREFARLKERFNKSDSIPDEIRKRFPALAKVAPEVLNRGERMMKDVDMDQQLMQAILRDIDHVSEFHDEPLKYSHVNGKHQVQLIHLPLSKSNDGTVTPSIKRCMEDLLQTIADDTSSYEHQDEAVDQMLDFLIKNHKPKLMKKLRQHRMVPKVMDEFDVAALLDEGGLKIWQWRAVQQCLKLFMDIDKVAVSETHLRELGKDHGEIKHGIYHFTDPENPGKVKEEVRFWTKDPVYEFLQAVEGLINGYDLDPLEIEFIHICHGGDHGKEKFRFASKVVLKMKNGEYYDDVFGLADVACRKDHAVILDNTCMPELIKGINIIEESDLVFSIDHSADSQGRFSIDLVRSNSHVSSVSIKPTSFLAGDLAFLAVMMGKKNFSGSWCNWCKLSKADWQAHGCEVNEEDLWNIARIIEQALLNDKNGFTDPKKTDTRMKGVRNSPILLIEFSRIIFSGLHAGIGIGNGLVSYLEVFIDVFIEEITHEEFQLREERSTIEGCVELLQNLKEVWTTSPEGGRALTKKRNRIKTINLGIKRGVDDDMKVAMLMEKGQLMVDVDSLVKQRDQYTKEISDEEKSLKEVKKKLDKMTKDRRGGEESVYTSIDRIFQKIGANRAHYFGRKFEGIDIRKIMAKSDDLFGVGGAIRQELLDHAPNADVVSKANEICTDVGLAFKLWDGVFSAIHKIDPSSDHCDKTQEMIDKAMAQLRSMDFSITPKMHGMEKHVVDQMRSIPGGISKLIEHWVEQYHQVGHRYDLSYCRAGTLENQAAIRSRLEKRARHPRVKMNKKLLEKKYKNIRRKRTAALEKEEV
ncbi:hypothetical protein ACHAXR_003576, partial [Thalassiosira sp. AJA248-18]